MQVWSRSTLEMREGNTLVLNRVMAAREALSEAVLHVVPICDALLTGCTLWVHGRRSNRGSFAIRSATRYLQQNAHVIESGTLRAVHLSHHKWPGGWHRLSSELSPTGYLSAGKFHAQDASHHRL